LRQYHKLILGACCDAGRIQRETVTQKKLGEALLNPKCIKEVSSVEAEQGRPSSALQEERLNGEHHFSDRKERVVASETCKGKKLQKETMYVYEAYSRKLFIHAGKCPELWQTCGDLMFLQSTYRLIYMTRQCHNPEDLNMSLQIVCE
jgi:hypothetical protein